MDTIVSVIITTYKRSDLLPRAINSVLSQTYKNVEVIVVDDNNPDSEYRALTEKKIKELYPDNFRLFYVKMPKNSGACAARNYGVSVCHGEYINFLDDDDELLPEKIEIQLNYFNTEMGRRCSAIGCQAEIVDGSGKFMSIAHTTDRGDVFFKQMCDTVSTLPQVLIRKDIFLKSGGFETMIASQEHWMLIRLFSVCPYFDFVPDTLVRIYHHGGPRISGSNRPYGAVALYDKSLTMLDRFTPKQAKQIKKARNKMIIDAFLAFGNRKEALHYFCIRLKKISFFDWMNILIFVRIILGNKVFNGLLNFICNVKHAITK